MLSSGQKFIITLKCDAALALMDQARKEVVHLVKKYGGTSLDFFWRMTTQDSASNQPKYCLTIEYRLNQNLCDSPKDNVILFERYQKLKGKSPHLDTLAQRYAQIRQPDTHGILGPPILIQKTQVNEDTPWTGTSWASNQTVQSLLKAKGIFMHPKWLDTLRDNIRNMLLLCFNHDNPQVHLWLKNNETTAARTRVHQNRFHNGVFERRLCLLLGMNLAFAELWHWDLSLHWVYMHGGASDCARVFQNDIHMANANKRLKRVVWAAKITTFILIAEIGMHLSAPQQSTSVEALSRVETAQDAHRFGLGSIQSFVEAFAGLFNDS